MTAVGYTGGDPNKVDVAGDTMTGPLVLPGDPVSSLQAATMNYVDTHSGGGGGGAVNSVFGRAGNVVAQSGDYTKAQIGLGSADNTSDVSKPVSTAQANADATVAANAANALAAHEADTTAVHGIANTANLVLTNDSRLSDARTPTAHAASHASGGGDPVTLAESQITNLVTDLGNKQPIDSDLTTIAAINSAGTGGMATDGAGWILKTYAAIKTALGLVKADVGLGSVDNTSDAGKPVSTAQQTALNLKADLASPTFSGTPSLPTGTTGVTQSAADSTTKLATTAFVTTADNLKAPLASPAFTGTPSLPTGATGVTQSAADSSTKLATTAFVTTADNLKANIASPTFTGTLTTPRIITPPVGLTDAATIATDASLGNHFRVTLGGNRTLGNPTNPTDGQRVIWEIIQDGTGTRTITLDTKFALGTDITAVTLTTTINKRDFMGAIYNSTADKWYVIALARGY